MTLSQVMKELESLADEKLRKLSAKSGAGENQFGVKMGGIRNVAAAVLTFSARARI